jgi:predicted nucleotidyltransferase
MQITDSQIEVLQKYLANTPAAFAYVFGSAVSGTGDKESDIDVAVGFSQQPGQADKEDAILDAIVEPVASALGVVPEKLDIKNFSQLPLSLRFRVVRDGKLIYLKDIASQRSQAVRAMREYDDEKPFFDLANKAFFNRYAVKNI